MKRLHFLLRVLLFLGIAAFMAWAIDMPPHYWSHLAGVPSRAAAYYEKGLSSQKGGGTAEALRWFRQAADLGHAGAQAKVGTAYATGTGLPEDPAEALRWWRKAAAQGNAEGQYGLALAHLSGSLIPQDKDAAVKLLQLAASQDFAPAQHRLAECYLHGDGVTEDLPEAARWYRRAAENGHAEAQVALGFICKRGLWGAPQDAAQAVQWFQKAAAQDDAKAQYQLGKCYADGTGVPKDLVEAMKWCLLASSTFGNDATQWIETHEKDLTSGQYAEARARAEAFRSPQQKK